VLQLEGKVALVTGSGHRLGQAIALRLASEGCRLMIHFHRSGEAAQATAEQIRDRGGRAETTGADLASSAGIDRLFTNLDAVYGGVDLLVNSAAILEPVDLLEANEEDWRRIVGLNLKAAYFVLQQAARRMLARGSGAIVNLSDSAAQRAWPRYPLHSISKAAVEALTRVAALRLAPTVRVNAVLPGPTLKPVGMKDERWEAISRGTPLGRAVDPADVARATTFLMKNEYITGHILRVDSGELLRR
jgi:NAD(P)-dependent dehydrogenase (short-subunit alcohol dehydrogenase family)